MNFESATAGHVTDLWPLRSQFADDEPVLTDSDVSDLDVPDLDVLDPDVLDSDVLDSDVPDSDVLVSPAEFVLPPEAIESDLLDCDGIPTLIAGVLSGTNVKEFLERLEVIAYTGTHSNSVPSNFLYEMFQTMERGQFDWKAAGSLQWYKKSLTKESSSTSPSMPNWPLGLLTRRFGIPVKYYPFARMNEVLLIFV